MKKISLIIVTIFSIFLLSSCQKIKTYPSDDARLFIDEIYQHISQSKGDYALIDVRYLEDYGNGHFKGVINYDIENGSEEEFLYKIESLYNKEKTLFLIDQDGQNVEALSLVLKKAGYKKIRIYLGGYENLVKVNQDDFQIVTGIDDCGC